MQLQDYATKKKCKKNHTVQINTYVKWLILQGEETSFFVIEPFKNVYLLHKFI